MKIGVDIDGVITNLDFIFNIKRSETILDPNITVKYCNVPVIRRLIFLGVTLYSKNAIIRNGASEVINQLKQDNNEIFIITKRSYVNDLSFEGQKIRNLTELYLFDNNIPYDKLLFAAEDKISEVKGFGVDLMIEDSPILSLKLAEYVPILLFSTPYNQNVKHPNIIRVSNWGEIYHIISERSLSVNKEKLLKFSQSKDK